MRLKQQQSMTIQTTESKDQRVGGESQLLFPVFVSTTKELVFSLPTQFEIHDLYGRLVKRGYGDSVKVSNLEKAEYYLSYDNATDTFNMK